MSSIVEHQNSHDACANVRHVYTTHRACRIYTYELPRNHTSSKTSIDFYIFVIVRMLSRSLVHFLFSRAAQHAFALWNAAMAALYSDVRCRTDRLPPSVRPSTCPPSRPSRMWSIRSASETRERAGGDLRRPVYAAADRQSSAHRRNLIITTLVVVLRSTSVDEGLAEKSCVAGIRALYRAARDLRSTHRLSDGRRTPLIVRLHVRPSLCSGHYNIRYTQDALGIPFASEVGRRGRPTGARCSK